MISQMTRYDFVVHHSELRTFLEALQQLGLVDVTIRDFEPTEQQLTMALRLESLKSTAHILGGVKNVNDSTEVSVDKAVEVAQRAVAAITAADSQIARLRTEVERTKIWGDFNPQIIKELQTQGLNIRLFEVSSKRFDPQWHTIYNVEVVARSGGMHYFAVVEYGETAVLDGVVEASVPEFPALELQQKIAKLELEIQDLQGELRVATSALPMIRAEIEELQGAIDFSNAHSSAVAELGGSIKIIEGFSDSLDHAHVAKIAEKMGVVMLSQVAKTQQNPPIKLRNNFFARLFEPIGAIYMFPRYNELDLTPFFAPFFMIFFGMCFGDAGYGVVLMLAILALWRKIPVAYRGFAWLGLFLNFSAVVFGLLTGNVFGIELMKIEALAGFRDYILQPTQIFDLSLILGGIQLSFGLILRTFNRIKRGGGFIYGVSNLGWLLLIFSTLAAMSGWFGDGFSTSSVAYQICLWAGVGLILFFTVPHRPVASIGKGLYSFYETATGIVGDLISYVRLFAIGLAGGVIAQVFNALAVGLSGDIPVLSIVLMLVILAVGHGLNIFISFLGAVVHPIRLTFVEFYKNAEFEGGGREFKPLKKKQK